MFGPMARNRGCSARLSSKFVTEAGYAPGARGNQANMSMAECGAVNLKLEQHRANFRGVCRVK